MGNDTKVLWVKILELTDIYLQIRYFFHLSFALLYILNSDVTGQRKWDFSMFFDFLWQMCIIVCLTFTIINHFIMAFWKQSYVGVFRNFTAYNDGCRRERRQLLDPWPSYQQRTYSIKFPFSLFLHRFLPSSWSCPCNTSILLFSHPKNI